MPSATRKPRQTGIRVGEAAEVLGVSIDTLRRWESSGRLKVSRTKGRQRLVAMSEIRRLQTERRQVKRDREREQAIHPWAISTTTFVAFTTHTTGIPGRKPSSSAASAVMRLTSRN